MKHGTLYGVSVGPGDSELMTLKAVRCLEQCSVIAAPRTGGQNSLALEIAAGAVDLSGKEIVYLDFAMKKDKGVLAETHRQQADRIEEYLAQGMDVAMLNLGDASLYGTFCYLRELTEADGYETVTIPGVTSFCAVAAELGQSLTNMGSALTVIPGSFPHLAEELARPGTKVIMKSASALPEVKRLLEEHGLTDKAAMAVNCGLPGQKLYQDIRQSDGTEGYFTTILVQE